MASGIVQGNRTLVCQDPHDYSSKDLWELENPLESPTPLFLVQVTLIAIVSQCINFLIKPLGQSTIVAQILGGLVFGQSALGRKKEFLHALFPARGTMTLETASSFGVMFFFFLEGVKMDPATLLRTERKAITIGLSVFGFSLAVPVAYSLALKKYVPMDNSLEKSLSFIATTQSITAFVVIAVLLNELKILNTDIGRLAMSAAMFGDIVGFVLTAVMFAILQNKGGQIWPLIWILLSAAALFFCILYVMRPAILWIFNRSKDGKPINELYIASIILLVMIAGLLSELIGQHYIMGPLILGLVVPEGPPLGTSLIAKLEALSHGFFYPMYLAVSGLETNLFKVDPQSLWIVGSMVLLSLLVKIGAVMLTGYYCSVSMKDCTVIGLILNARGIAELVIYNLWKGSKILTEQEFSLVVFSIIAVNAIIAPLIKLLYDPSAQYYSATRNSIQHTKRESELKVMICIHSNEDIPTMINLLEASYANEESTVGVIALVLVELWGRSRPLLVAHQPHENLHTASSDSTHINNALMQFAQQHEGHASVQFFTSMSHMDTMHHDICRIALEGKANILIMPFHKKWEIDGSVDETKKAIQKLNVTLLEKAPCSVGILVDRGILGGSSSLLAARLAYHVAVIFIGGADDAEALAYGTRMARHEGVEVTVVRLLQFGAENSIVRKRESDLMDEYRLLNVGNPRFEIIDEVIRDGIEMSSSLRRLVDYFDMVMVGREHPDCTMLEGHVQWSECRELGVVGDMLASQDFVSKASVLVVQQQRVRRKLVKHTVSVPSERDQLVHDVPLDAASRSSWTISMDKYDPS